MKSGASESRLTQLLTSAREYLTHWAIAGTILTLTGFAPDHWVAALLSHLAIPESVRNGWLPGFDIRIALVAIGVAIIAWDVLRRSKLERHGTLRDSRQDTLESARTPDQSNDGERQLQTTEIVTLALSDKPSIAVLPFENMSGDASQAYIADGFTEDLITALSKYHWLHVVARNSCFAFKGQAVDVRHAAQVLEATYVVEGSVRRAGNHLRVTAQLSDGTTGKHLWADRYDREMQDLFALQDEINGMIVGRLEPELGVAERTRASQKPTQNLGAWDCYHIGLSQMYHFTREGNVEAQQMLRRAIELDPRFAQAHARLAYCMILEMVYFDARPVPEALDEALRLAQSAVALDAEDAFCLMALGRVHIARREYEMGRVACNAAVTLNPSMGLAYCAMGDALAYSGNVVDAIPCFEEAIRLSPNDPWRWAFYAYGALGFILVGRHEQAVEWAQKAILVPHCQYWAWAHLAAALGYLGRTAEAAATLEELKKLRPGFSLAYAQEKLFYLDSREQIELYVEGLRRAGMKE